MAELYSFKPSYSRGSRSEVTESSFSSGMQHTFSPLDEGWARVLSNFDMHDSGAALKPRPGLQTVQAFTSDTTTNAATTIVAAKEQYVDKDTTVAQFLTIEPAADGKFNLRVVSGATAPVTADLDDASELYAQVTWHNYKVSDPVLVNCVYPANAEIHGIPIDNTVLARHPGAYGWNGKYYFFDQANKQLKYTDWDEEDAKFVFKTDDPKEITAKEAVRYGYNMLLENPYTFSNSEAASGSVISFEGMMPYDADGELCLTPVVNQSLTFEIFYKVPLNKKYHIVFEWRSSTTNTWSIIKELDSDFTEVGEIKIPFTPPEENIILRVSAYGYTGDTLNAYTDATLAVGFNFDKDSYGNTANLKNDKYTLTEATGVTYWKNRLILWGVPEDATVMFASEVNDPTYFPYPNNCDTFEEPIKYCVPFLDNLLVFTSSKLYMLTLLADGSGWTQKLIQNNLTIADWDIHLIQVVKNMLFFRSGNYFYMIVPKATSSTGELTLAAVSKPMYYFFDKFEENVAEIVDAMYNYMGDLTLKQYYNYLDFEDIHNVYVFANEHDELLNIDLLYNTVSRHWRMYCTGTQSIQSPYKQDMTQKGTLCSACIDPAGNAAFQLHRYNNVDNRDYYVVNCSKEAPDVAFEQMHVWKNWQFLDTGYRAHQSNLKKRYRELQFVINNRSNRNLSFYTDFFIDGAQRRTKFKYNVVHDTNPESPNYKSIVVERVLAEPLTVPGHTLLGSDETDIEAWTLDNSAFPGDASYKVRFQVSGKGYTPRMLLISHNEVPYELLSTSWVYRLLYSR